MTNKTLFRAIGLAEERQVLEADAPLPVRKNVRWPRYAALAACLALVLGLGLHSLLRWRTGSGSFVADTESFTEGADAGSDQLVADTGTGMNSEPQRPAMFSEHVEISYPDEVPVPDAAVGSSSCLAAMTPEEIFARDTAIFRGTVTDLNYLAVDFRDGTRYYTAATVSVSEVFRGDLTADGTTYGILLPCVPGFCSTSIAGALEELTVGSEAIFMPYAADGTTGLRVGDQYFCYADGGTQFYFNEGVRFLFLEQDGALIFERNTYDAIAEATTLDEVGAWIRTMLP